MTGTTATPNVAAAAAAASRSRNAEAAKPETKRTPRTKAPASDTKSTAKSKDAETKTTQVPKVHILTTEVIDIDVKLAKIAARMKTREANYEKSTKTDKKLFDALIAERDVIPATYYPVDSEFNPDNESRGFVFSDFAVNTVDVIKERVNKRKSKPVQTAHDDSSESDEHTQKPKSYILDFLGGAFFGFLLAAAVIAISQWTDFVLFTEIIPFFIWLALPLGIGYLVRRSAKDRAEQPVR